MSGPLQVSYIEATDPNTGNQFYLELDNEKNDKDILKGVPLVGPSVVPFPDNATYVFRKMCLEEFEATKKQQLLQYNLNNKTGKEEQWLTESLRHSREFHNKKVQGAETVAEFKVDKPGYNNMREAAIPQHNSSRLQPREGLLKNLHHDEQLKNHPTGKRNLGLKGRGNVDCFNQHVIKVSEVDPHSFINQNSVLRWVRRNKIHASCIALGVIVDGANLAISIVEDDGSFGKNTQINIGEMAGGVACAHLATVIGAKIGAAIGTVIPFVGNLVLGFIGGLIGALIGGGIVKLARYLFCISPPAPGLGPPILDTDPHGTYSGVPSTGMKTGVYGVPASGMNTGARGVPSLGHNTYAKGTPKADYNTR